LQGATICMFGGQIMTNTAVSYGGLFHQSSSVGILRGVRFGDNGAQHITPGLNYQGNYWENGMPLTPANLIACEDAGCTTDFTLDFTGTGGGKIDLSHADLDGGFAAIFDMLNTLEY